MSTLTPTTLGNRPDTLPPRTRISDYSSAGQSIRVTLKLVDPQPDRIVIDAQAFAVNAHGAFLTAPDGRPSRTPSSAHVVIASSLGDTHTLHPGWVRVVGDYDEATVSADIPRGSGRPAAAPDANTNPSGQVYDTDTGTLWRWDAGELAHIETAKAHELLTLLAHSGAISGLEF